MPLPLEQKEIKINEGGIGETGNAVENAVEEAAEQVKKAVEQGSPLPEADVLKLKKPDETAKSREVQKEEIKRMTPQELEQSLTNEFKIKNFNQWEKDSRINSIIQEMAEKITEKEEEPQNITQKILGIAYNTCDNDDGTYAWILSELEKRIHDELRKRGI